MPTKFAFPVSHGNTTPVTRGVRPFHQPIAGAPAGTVPGLELFLPDTDPGFRLFAVFDGKLRWRPGSGNDPNLLELIVDVVTASPILRKVPNVESIPLRLIYENVDRNGVRAALTSVLSVAYQNALTLPPKSWHPSMRQVRKNKNVASLVKEVMDQNGGASFAVNIVDEMLNDVDISGLVFRAGDHIGNVAPATQSLSPDPSTPRRVVLYMMDAGEQRINPLHYLHLFTHQPNQNNVIVDENLTNHPLRTAYPELVNATRPPARIPVTVGSGLTESDFALGTLNDSHNYRRSNIKWFYDLEAKLAVENEGDLKPTADDTAIAKRIWDQQGGNIAEICDKLQIPCELVVAVVSGESGGNEKVFRFEPMSRKTAERAAAHQDLLLKYDRTLGTRIASYEPKREPIIEGNLGLNPITTLVCHLDDAVTLGGNSSNSRSVFLVDDVWRPVLERVTEKASSDTHTVALREERMLNVLSQTGTTSSTAPRKGRVRVLRGQLNSKAPTDITVTLSAPSGSISLTVAQGKTFGAEVEGQLDLAAGDAVSLVVAPAGLSIKSQVEWFLGVAGADEASTPANMWIIPDGGGSASGYPPIPEPWNPLAVVRTGRTDTNQFLNWGDVVTLIQSTGIPNVAAGGDFLSPGITQTLVSTAWSLLRTAEALAPGLRVSLGIPTVNSAEELLTTGWLLQARNALFVGLVKMRDDYNKLDTRFDLPVVHSWFFGRGPLGQKAKANTRWGVSSPTPGFIDILGRRYNAAINLFLGPSFPTVRPTVRYQK